MHNTARYLDHCVRSILQQSLSDFELILVDDGSTDGCEQACDRWARADGRIRVVHRPCGGRSAARNTGLGLARGVYLTFVDSDDSLEPRALEMLLRAARQSGADMAIGRHRTVTPQGLPLQTVGPDSHAVLDHDEALRLILHDHKLKGYVWGKLFRRSMVQGVPFPEGRVYEDVATIYRWADRARRVALTPYVGYVYLKNPRGIVMAGKGTARWAAGAVDNVQAWTERYHFCLQRPELADTATFCAVHTLLMILRFEERCLRYRFVPTMEQIVVLARCRHSLHATPVFSLTPRQAARIALAQAKLRAAWGIEGLATMWQELVRRMQALYTGV